MLLLASYPSITIYIQCQYRTTETSIISHTLQKDNYITHAGEDKIFRYSFSGKPRNLSLGIPRRNLPCSITVDFSEVGYEMGNGWS
jgi:hypothetical protein